MKLRYTRDGGPLQAFGLEFAYNKVVEYPASLNPDKIPQLLSWGCEIVGHESTVEEIVAELPANDTPSMEELRDTARNLGIARVGVMGRDRLIEEISNASTTGEDDG